MSSTACRSTSKVTKTRAPKKAAQNKKIPRKMKDMMDSNAVWGQRWFRNVDHANGGEQGELDLGSTSTSSAPTISKSPSPDAIAVTDHTTSMVARSTTTVSAPVDAAPLHHNLFSPTDRHVTNNQGNTNMYPTNLPWDATNPSDDYSTSYNLFAAPYQTEQPYPDHTTEHQHNNQPYSFSTYDLYSYPVYPTAPSPIAPSSPASSEGWSLSPIRPLHEVEPITYGNVVSGLSAYPPSSTPSSLLTIPQPQYHGASYPSAIHGQTSAAVPQHIHPGSARADMSDYYHMQQPSHSDQMTGYQHFDSSVHRRHVSPAAHSRPVGLTPTSNHHTVVHSTHPRLHGASPNPYSYPPPQYSPSTGPGDRFDSSYVQF
ncbi:hypothetical protein PC9H_004749 [Pleurotus ostreatus]|uniref:Uncharacterized protein n=1 Tax=Pleurotus ostreatus TaxID=5322 RepID=A0A8H6ZXT5_PLEOS|nr:uncharacterized protein PC9H_004749 [Pleurotus ostreatus]KAF7432806.1 hypothetical protein PC9H_004749 [Pleurotus ostreatus]KAJ8698639.1 hypothetical protein PTI98_005326 [Pleurotus ostreatus]